MRPCPRWRRMYGCSGRRSRRQAGRRRHRIPARPSRTSTTGPACPSPSPARAAPRASRGTRASPVCRERRATRVRRGRTAETVRMVRPARRVSPGPTALPALLVRLAHRASPGPRVPRARMVSGGSRASVVRRVLTAQTGTSCRRRPGTRTLWCADGLTLRTAETILSRIRRSRWPSSPDDGTRDVRQPCPPQREGRAVSSFRGYRASRDGGHFAGCWVNEGSCWCVSMCREVCCCVSGNRYQPRVGHGWTTAPDHVVLWRHASHRRADADKTCT